MFTSLYTGISGMDANGTALSVVGDNIANMNTTGFKNSRVEFGDVLSQSIAGASQSSQVGRGVRVSKVQAQFTQGSFETTQNGLDLAVDGDGLFIVRNGDAKYYTRAGQFSLDKDGNVVNVDGYVLQGFQVDNNGNIIGAVEDVSFSNQTSQAKATTESSVAVNLDAAATIPAAAFTLDSNADGIDDDPANYNDSTTIKVYDSLGGGHDITLYFCKTAAGTWDVNFVNADPTDSSLLVVAGTQALSFDTDGSLIDDNSGTAIAFDFGADVVTPQDILFDFGTGTGEATPGTGFDGTTQYSASFSVGQLTQDGNGSGAVSNISIGESGLISASFTNGQTRSIGQLALARFLDQGSLMKLGRNLYQETYESGQPVVSKPETSGLGRILSNTLELSNVDLAQEFVKLISAQRAFQANSRIITTTDELYQELINIKR